MLPLSEAVCQCSHAPFPMGIGTDRDRVPCAIAIGTGQARPCLSGCFVDQRRTSTVSIVIVQAVRDLKTQGKSFRAASRNLPEVGGTVWGDFSTALEACPDYCRDDVLYNGF
jgi:hypothetical protein